MTVTIDASGLDNLLLLFERFPQVTRTAMSIALNDTARDVALKAARRDITAQVAFPDGYLDEPGRLYISQYSTPTRLETKITARDRPTSLARFAAPGTRVSRGFAKPGAPKSRITVTVKPGHPITIPSESSQNSVFLLGLLNGNIGLAIRLRPGQSVKSVKRYQPIQIFPNVFLLYGPSVNQVLDSIAAEFEPEVTSALEAEFNRQFVRLTGAG